MRITVLVPTFRRTADLRRCLEALQTQARPADEMLVTVRDTDKETQGFFASFDPGALPLRVVPVCEPGVIAAMNAGLEAAQCDILALTDDDTEPHPDWLERINAYFTEDAHLGGVGGRDWQPAERGMQPVVGKVQWHGRVIGNHHLGLGEPREVDIIKGANCAYRIEPLRRIGFDRRLQGDGAQVHWELSLGLAMKRAGWKLIYDPAVAVEHHLGQRFDIDQRGYVKFNVKALRHTVYNETLVLLEDFSFVRGSVFFLWSCLMGTQGSPGLLQLPRLMARREASVGLRYKATMMGRFAALRVHCRSTGVRVISGKR